MPGNFDQPSHAVLRDVAGSDRWRGLLAGVEFNRQARDPAEYLDLLAGAGCQVDAWETTYLHVLAGGDPVVEWYRGTGLRPVLSALDAAQAEEFVAAYREGVARAYPRPRMGRCCRFAGCSSSRPGPNRARVRRGWWNSPA